MGARDGKEEGGRKCQFEMGGLWQKKKGRRERERKRQQKGDTAWLDGCNTAERRAEGH